MPGMYLGIDGVAKKIVPGLNDLTDLEDRVHSLEGRGGALQHFDFGTATPTQQALTQYACLHIWGTGTLSWTATGTYYGNSTYTQTDGVVRTVTSIFNATWVKNDFDGVEWQLVNTPDTTPKIFEWIDVGQPFISDATTGLAGVVQLATNAEVLAGTNNTKAITPAGLSAKIIISTTDLTPGVSPLATNAVYLVYD